MPESVTRWPPHGKSGLKQKRGKNCSYALHMPANATILKSIEAKCCVHTHVYIHAKNHSGTVRLCSLGPGRLPVKPCFFFLHKTWSKRAREAVGIQYVCCERAPHLDCATRKLSLFTLARTW